MVYRVVFNYVDAKMNQVKVYFKIYIFFLITKFYDNLMIFEHQVLQKQIQLVQHSLCNMTSSALSLDIRNAIISLWSYFQRLWPKSYGPSSLPDLNIICFKFSQILFNFLNSLIYWKIMKIFKYLACTCPAHFWSCMFQSKAKKSDGQVAKIVRTNSGLSWLLGVNIL